MWKHFYINQCISIRNFICLDIYINEIFRPNDMVPEIFNSTDFNSIIWFRLNNWIELKLRRLVRWRFILSDKVMTSNHFWPLDVEIFGAKNDQSIIFNDRNLGKTFQSWYFVLTFQMATFQTSIQTSHFFPQQKCPNPKNS